MSAGALEDLLAALALAAVIEGVAIALAAPRLGEMLAQLSLSDPEVVRWAALAMAVLGALAYLLLRS